MVASSKPNPRYANGHRRRELRARVLAAYDTCALCGRWVDKGLHHWDPMAPEVDEIVPVSRGGNPLAWNNVQLAHRLCNQRKSDSNDAVARAKMGLSVQNGQPVVASPDW